MILQYKYTHYYIIYNIIKNKLLRFSYKSIFLCTFAIKFQILHIMKKSFLLVAIAMIFATASCSKDNPHSAQTKQITFLCDGGWEQTQSKDLTANGTSMTDIWIFDYVGNSLVQTVHQNDNTAADFGSPSVYLSYGNHTLYFVASRGSNATVNNSTHSIRWGKPSDTFFKSTTINVTSTTATTQSVSLDRVVSKLKLTINDVIPSGIERFTITPTLWYFGIDYTTGNPSAPDSNAAISVNCPASSIGQSGQFITVYSPSGSTQWQTNVNLSAYSSSSLISSVSISNVPLQRNISTEYNGYLFSSGRGFNLSLNDTWGGTNNGSW